MNDWDDGEGTSPRDVMNSLGRLVVIQYLYCVESKFELSLRERKHVVVLLDETSSVFVARVVN